MDTQPAANSWARQASAGIPTNALVIWGAGGHGKVVLDIAGSTGHFEQTVFLDDDLRKSGLSFCGCPVVGGPDELYRLAGSYFIVAVGNNNRRAKCYARAFGSGLFPATIVHPTAAISISARIGAGTVVMPGAVINADAVIEENCIINSGAIVEHDCSVGAHVHIAPRAVLGGGVNVGTSAHVGIGAVVLPGARIGNESVVGAGAVVLREAPAHCTVVGVPSKRLIRL